MNYKNLLRSTISSSANLFVNKKLLATYGVEVASLIAFLVDKENYHDEDEFYCTNLDILLYTGITEKRLVKIKEVCQKADLFKINLKGNPVKSFYKINHKKLLEILSSDIDIKQLAYKRLKISDKNLQDYTEDELTDLTKKELVLLCKKNSIAYKGNFKKIDYILAILSKIKLLPNGVTSYHEKESLVTPKRGNQLLPNGVQKKTNQKTQNKKNKTESEKSVKASESDLSNFDKNLIGVKLILDNDLDKFDSNFLKELTQYKHEDIQDAYSKAKSMNASNLGGYMRTILKDKVVIITATEIKSPISKTGVIRELKKDRTDIIKEYMDAHGVGSLERLSDMNINILNISLRNAGYEEVVR